MQGGRSRRQDCRLSPQPWCVSKNLLTLKDYTPPPVADAERLLEQFQAHLARPFGRRACTGHLAKQKSLWKLKKDHSACYERMLKVSALATMSVATIGEFTIARGRWRLRRRISPSALLTTWRAIADAWWTTPCTST